MNFQQVRGALTTVLCIFLCILCYTEWQLVTNYQNVTPIFESSRLPAYLDKTLSKVNTTTYICSHAIGGLGNRMLQYMAVYSIAKQTGKTPIYTQKGLEIFPHRTIAEGKCVTPSAKRSEKGAGIYTESLLDLPKWENVTICCYYLSWKYMLHYEADIRREFTISDELKKEAQSFLSNVSGTVCKRNPVNVTANASHHTPPITFVGVHVRRGDKLRNQIFTGQIVPPRSYLVKAMTFYRLKHKNVHFVVCSNDLPWCKQNLKFNDVSFCDGRSRESDFTILASCNHSIMTIGSFGWWSSWLAGGDVVYYYNLRPNYSMARIMKQKDVVRPEWIQMSE